MNLPGICAMQINESVFIVTGGTSGLGEATARQLHQGGARVLIVDIAAERGEALAAALGAAATANQRASTSSTTVFSSTPMRLISISTRSPARNQIGGLRAMPTPPGVPVTSTSPGCRRVNVDR